MAMMPTSEIDRYNKAVKKPKPLFPVMPGVTDENGVVPGAQTPIGLGIVGSAIGAASKVNNVAKGMAPVAQYAMKRATAPSPAPTQLSPTPPSASVVPSAAAIAPSVISQYLQTVEPRNAYGQEEVGPSRTDLAQNKLRTDADFQDKMARNYLNQKLSQYRGMGLSPTADAQMQDQIEGAMGTAQSRHMAEAGQIAANRVPTNDPSELARRDAGAREYNRYSSRVQAGDQLGELATQTQVAEGRAGLAETKARENMANAAGDYAPKIAEADARKRLTEAQTGQRIAEVTAPGSVASQARIARGTQYGITPDYIEGINSAVNALNAQMSPTDAGVFSGGAFGGGEDSQRASTQVLDFAQRLQRMADEGDPDSAQFYAQQVFHNLPIPRQDETYGFHSPIGAVGEIVGGTVAGAAAGAPFAGVGAVPGALIGGGAAVTHRVLAGYHAASRRDAAEKAGRARSILKGLMAYGQSA